MSVNIETLIKERLISLEKINNRINEIFADTDTRLIRSQHAHYAEEGFKLIEKHKAIELELILLGHSTEKSGNVRNRY